MENLKSRFKLVAVTYGDGSTEYILKTYRGFRRTFKTEKDARDFAGRNTVVSAVTLDL